MKLRHTILPAAILLVGAGCSQPQPVVINNYPTQQQPTAQQQPQANPQDPATEQLMVQNSVYKNNKYGFQFTFPTSWGKITEKETSGNLGGLMSKVITLTSQKDSQRYLSVNLVKKVDAEDWRVVDAPMEKVGGNSTYVFLVSGSADCYGKPDCDSEKHRVIFEEMVGIKKSFKVE